MLDANESSDAAQRPLVIASSLSDAQNEKLAAHRSRPTIIKITIPWEPPPEASTLFTYQTQWRTAPQTAPRGWPFNLRWAQVASAGLDTFPPWFFEAPLVTRGRGVQAPAMAEYVIAVIMAREKRLWDVAVSSAAEWKHRLLGAVAGKTIGIAGFGAIGEEIARRAIPLGLRVLALTRSRAIHAPNVAQTSSLSELMASSDHLVLALPLTEETRGAVNSETLSRARPGLHLINIARGAIIDDAALLAALDSGAVAAATLDVTSPEPLPDGHPFYSHPRIRLTPHVSGMSEDHEERLSAWLLRNLDRFMAGENLDGVVDRRLRY